MSEDRPQYQAERDTVPTNAEIAERLRDVCAQMLVLSIDMQYVGGFGETAKKGDALALLATLVDAHDIIDAIGQPQTAEVADRMRATIAKARGDE